MLPERKMQVRKVEGARETLILDQPTPEPANDNIGPAQFENYVIDARRQAGSNYQRAATKMFWLP